MDICVVCVVRQDKRQRQDNQDEEVQTKYRQRIKNNCDSKMAQEYLPKQNKYRVEQKREHKIV